MDNVVASGAVTEIEILGNARDARSEWPIEWLARLVAIGKPSQVAWTNPTQYLF